MTIDASRTMPDCTAGYRRILIPGLLGKYNIKQVYSTCWLSTSAGVQGDSSGIRYISLGPNESAAAIDTAYGTQELVGSRLLRKYRIGSQGSNVSIHDQPILTMKLATYNSTVYHNYLTLPANSSTVWAVTRPNSTQNAVVNHHGSSRNGKWLVLEESQAFVRVNLETRESLPFEKPLYGYGYGLDPTYELDISDDGRFVSINGGNIYERKVKLYDLSTCDATRIVDNVSPGCARRDIKQFMVTNIATEHVDTLYFNSSSDMLFYSMQENGVWRRYSLSPEGTLEHYIDYLALGDSYSSGEGDGDGAKYYLPGTDGDGADVPGYQTDIADYPYDKEKCHNSIRSYSYLLAAAAQLSANGFRSVACSGADANDVVNIDSNDNVSDGLRFDGHFDQMQHFDSTDLIVAKLSALDNFTPGRAAQLEFVIKYRPRAVTIGLGGNDLKFGDILAGCVMSKLSSCEYATTNRSLTGVRLHNEVYDRLVDTYTKLRQASPTTRIFVHGYPQLFTDSDSCDLNAQLDKTERQYARETVAYLNDIVEAAATRTGVTYIDIEDSLAGTNLCSGADQPTINGLTSGNDVYGIIGSESYHPNEKAHALIAQVIRQKMDNQSILDYNPCEVIVSCTPSASIEAPDIPMYFRTLPSTASSRESKMIEGSGTVAEVQLDSPQVDIQTDMLFSPDSDVVVTLHSTPVQLGVARADATGSVGFTSNIPLSTPLGYHEIHITGISRSGQPVDVYQSLRVIASSIDADGDGVVNTLDGCPFVDLSGRDRDQDGIDDACDGVIGPAPVVISPPTPTPETVPGPGTLPEPESTTTQQGSDRTTSTSVPSSDLTAVLGTMTYRGPIAVVPDVIAIPGGGSVEEPTKSELHVATADSVSRRDVDVSVEPASFPAGLAVAAGTITLATLVVISRRLPRR